MALRKDGGLSRVDQSDAAPSQDFNRILEWTRRQIGEHADGMLDGKVVVRPYRLGTFSPCSWCDQRPVCRFEHTTTKTRNLNRLKRSEIFDSLR